jgi:hypothetical protein
MAMVSQKIPGCAAGGNKFNNLRREVSDPKSSVSASRYHVPELGDWRPSKNFQPWKPSRKFFLPTLPGFFLHFQF